MIISYTKTVTTSVIVTAAILVSCVIDENRQGQVISAPEKATETAEYHYSGKYCSDCHDPIPQQGGNQYLKFGGDFNILCKCHAPRDYIHPVNIAPSAPKRIRIPADFPLQQGKVTCLTCHDIYWQCQKRRVDKNSLRGARTPKRSEFCYKCHDKALYMKRDIHNQMDSQGKIIGDSCLYCHPDKPDESVARYKDVKFVGDLEMICQRCHVIRGNHSGNFNHMVRPSADMLAHMQAIEKKFGIILPLDENGKLTCITCHNPHDKGVIRAESPAARGAGSKYRHRLPGRLCLECHQKKFGILLPTEKKTADRPV